MRLSQLLALTELNTATVITRDNDPRPVAVLMPVAAARERLDAGTGDADAAAAAGGPQAPSRQPRSGGAAAMPSGAGHARGDRGTDAGRRVPDAEPGRWPGSADEPGFTRPPSRHPSAQRTPTRWRDAGTDERAGTSRSPDRADTGTSHRADGPTGTARPPVRADAGTSHGADGPTGTARPPVRGGADPWEASQAGAAPRTARRPGEPAGPDHQDTPAPTARRPAASRQDTARTTREPAAGYERADRRRDIAPYGPDEPPPSTRGHDRRAAREQAAAHRGPATPTNERPAPVTTSGLASARARTTPAPGASRRASESATPQPPAEAAVSGWDTAQGRRAGTAPVSPARTTAPTATAADRTAPDGRPAPSATADGWARRLDQLREQLTRRHRAEVDAYAKALTEAWAELDRLSRPGTDREVDDLRAAQSHLMGH